MSVIGTLDKEREHSGASRESANENSRLLRLNVRMNRLVGAVQDLSLSKDLASVMLVVRRAARELTGADGATFVLRESDLCLYAEEDAIAPLWKGQRFPMNACISGWAMLNGRPAVIEDIYGDSRIPADVYRPTFVKSLAMVPIRPDAPLGAIGNYWANRHRPTDEEVEVLQALANTTAVAMENVQLYSELEERVRQRTDQLRQANEELEAFNYAASHDLVAPLRRIRGFCDLLQLETAGKLDEGCQSHLQVVCRETDRMNDLIRDLLRLSQISRNSLHRKTFSITRSARQIIDHLRSEAPDRVVEAQIEEHLEANADPGLMDVLMGNLLSNAWKYTAKMERARIEVRARELPDGTRAFLVRDNGAGFDGAAATELFKPFRRFHAETDFPGNGIGLATVRRIVERHGGHLWAETAPGKGATFYFTLG